MKKLKLDPKKLKVDSFVILSKKITNSHATLVTEGDACNPPPISLTDCQACY